MKIIDFLEDKIVTVFTEDKNESVKMEASEVLVALLLASGEKLSADENTEIPIEHIKKILTSGSKTKKIIGSEGLNKYISLTKDYGASYSAAAKIKKIIGSKTINQIILSGQSVSEAAVSKRIIDIINFSPQNKKMKSYNPADLLVVCGKKIYGISLKKKTRSSERDPTLINRSLMDFTKSVFNEKIQKDLENTRVKYFSELLKIRSQKPSQKDIIAKVKAMDAAYEQKKKSKTKSKDDVRPSQTFFNKKLLSQDNYFFKKIDSVLNGNKEIFIDSFLKEVFRIELKDLMANDFSFFTVTGIGRTGAESVKIEPGKYSEFSSTIETLDELMTKKKIKFSKTPGKKHAFEEGATAAKLFYSVYADNTQILEIEMRYKGKFESNPQFFVLPTKNFVNVFKHG